MIRLGRIRRPCFQYFYIDLSGRFFSAVRRRAVRDITTKPTRAANPTHGQVATPLTQQTREADPTHGQVATPLTQQTREADPTHGQVATPLTQQTRAADPIHGQVATPLTQQTKAADPTHGQVATPCAPFLTGGQRRRSGPHSELFIPSDFCPDQEIYVQTQPSCRATRLGAGLL